MNTFDTHNKRDGSPKECKFCHEHVWWHRFERRWYNPGGMVLHVETCELRQKHFHDKALDGAEARRAARAAGGGE